MRSFIVSCFAAIIIAIIAAVVLHYVQEPVEIAYSSSDSVRI